MDTSFTQDTDKAVGKIYFEKWEPLFSSVVLFNYFKVPCYFDKLLFRDK